MNKQGSIPIKYLFAKPHGQIDLSWIMSLLTSDIKGT